MVVRYLNLEFRLEIIDVYNLSLYIFIYHMYIIYKYLGISIVLILFKPRVWMRSHRAQANSF